MLTIFVISINDLHKFTPAAARHQDVFHDLNPKFVFSSLNSESVVYITLIITLFYALNPKSVFFALNPKSVFSGLDPKSVFYYLNPISFLCPES